MNLRYSIGLILFFCSMQIFAQSATIYWIASDSSNWNNGANWSKSSGGPACGCVPASTDIVGFNGGPDGTKDGVCFLDVSSASLLRFVFTDQYDGKLNLNGNDVTTIGQSSFNNATIVDYIGTSKLNLNGGGFTALNSSITVGKITYANASSGITIDHSIITADQSISITISGATNYAFEVRNNSTINTPSLSITTVNLQLDGGTFNGITHSFTKTSGGKATNNSKGGNKFNANLTKLITTTSSDIILATEYPDDFNGDVYFGCANSSGSVAVGYNYDCTISGNITTSSGINALGTIDGVTFGYNTGYVILDGEDNQTINVTNETYTSPTNVKGPTFGNLRIAKPNGKVLLSSTAPTGARPLVKIDKVLDFQRGIISVPTVAFPLLHFNASSTAINASDVSFVEGKVYKQGSEPFTFPIGKNGFYRPLGITEPTLTSTFTAEYIQANPGNTTNITGGLATVSSLEYWTLERTAGTGDILVSLTWNESAFQNADDYIQQPEHLVVAYLSGTTWNNLEGRYITGDEKQGILTSAFEVPLYPTRFTLGSNNFGNPLPVSLISFTAEKTSHGIELNWDVASEINNEYYLIEHALDPQAFTPLEKIPGRGTTYEQQSYSFNHHSFNSGRQYYRLRQIDFDGKTTTLGVRVVDEPGRKENFFVWPTHLSHDRILYMSMNTSGTVFDGFANPVLIFQDTSEVDLSSLSTGVYFIKNTDNQVVRFAVVD